MAFTSRSARDYNHFTKPQTLSHVGPGSYRTPELIDPTSHLRLTSTPFSSTSKRETVYIDKEKEELPGPGSYYREASVKKRRAASTIFRSKTSRFDPKGENMKNSQVPGPGSYNTPVMIGRSSSPVRREPSSHTHSQMWSKISSIPSIPSSNQSHGYEEGPRGELIPQSSPQNGHSGDSRDRVGPGEYYVNEEYLARKRETGSSFRSTTKREVFQSRTVAPGPGQYDTERAEHLLHYQQPKSIRQESAVFLSGSGRGDLFSAPKEQTPGPGEYGYKSSFIIEKVPEKNQNFGSTSVRIYTAPESVLTQPMPGPGYYSTSPIPSASLPVVRKPFSSTTERFSGPRRSSPLPGPGAYDQDMKMSSLAAELETKGKVGSYGVFGSTSRRFNTQKPKAPGPGQYDYETPDKAIVVKKNDSRTSAFVSRTKRDLFSVSKDVLDGPSVGQYEVKSDWLKKKTNPYSQQDVFVSKSPRFKPDPKMAPPGPGTYDHEAFLAHKASKSFLSTSNGLPKSIRFHHKTVEDDAPGPGAYNLESNFLKKTYNVTI